MSLQLMSEILLLIMDEEVSNAIPVIALTFLSELQNISKVKRGSNNSECPCQLEITNS